MNMASIKQHIKTERHNLLKSNPDAEKKKPAGLHQAGYVLIDKVILSKSQWHSIVDKKCHICDVDVKNVDAHVDLEAHMLNLIGAETKYTDNQYYRKVNDKTYHCFACKKIYSTEDYEKHLETCENVDEMEVKALKEAETTASLEKFSQSVSCIEEVEQTLLRTFHDFYNIDEATNTAECKYCSEPVSIDFKSLLLHLRDKHNTKEERPQAVASSDESTDDEEETGRHIDYGQRRSKMAKYGKSHHIKLNHNATKGYCTICDKHLAASKTVFKEHCKGLIHRGHLELLGLKKPDTERLNIEYSMQSVMTFVKHMHYSPKSHSVMINEDFNINMNNFLLVHPILGNPHFKKTKCYLCNELFELDMEAEHCLTRKHKDLFIESQVIAKPEEFVRLIRPNLYHCAFCNVTLPFSQSLEIHLQTKKHRDSKVTQILIKDIPEGGDQEPVVETEETNVEDDRQYAGLLNNFCGSTSL